MVREIRESEIDAFIDFGDRLYRGDRNYVPYMRDSLRKMLRRLVFEKRRYCALCSFDERGRINARILLTVKPSKQLETERCGYFSFFECVEDRDVFTSLMAASMYRLREMGAQYMCGSFFPHDPDNRRGILIKGFDTPPMIFTSHNKRYYRDLFERGGFEKLTDAYEYEYAGNDETIERIRTKAESALSECDINIRPLDMKHIDSEIEAVHRIMEVASTQVNFEKVMTKEEMEKVFKGMKRYIDPNFGFIARRNSDGQPIGFTLSIPDYFELIRKMRGRTDLWGIIVFFFCRRHIHGLRAMLQYILPEYQHKGVSKALYWETKKAVDRKHIKRVSLGTIMEANGNSNHAIESIGGRLSRIYRIYYRKIEE